MVKLRRLISFSILAGVTLLSFNNCTLQPAQVRESENSVAEVEFYFRKMNSLVVDVFYEPGAEPFDGNAGASPYWQILEDNLRELFKGRSVSYAVPKTLAQMHAIPVQSKTQWTLDDIYGLFRGYAASPTSSTEGRFFIVFLNGYYSEGGNAQPGTIGINISGTPIIAIFKDVIKSTGASPTGPVPKYVEQATLIHEMGHALGLVNNGLPLTTSHHDHTHGAHCSNPNCVMYYLNEGKSDMLNFVQQVITSGSRIMYGQECLKDAQNYQ